MILRRFSPWRTAKIAALAPKMAVPFWGCERFPRLRFVTLSIQRGFMVLRARKRNGARKKTPSAESLALSRRRKSEWDFSPSDER